MCSSSFLIKSHSCNDNDPLLDAECIIIMGNGVIKNYGLVPTAICPSTVCRTVKELKEECSLLPPGPPAKSPAL